MIDGFKKGSGCFTCELCGKKTRVVDVNMPYCPYCIRIMEKENEGEDKKGDDLNDGKRSKV